MLPRPHVFLLSQWCIGGRDYRHSGRSPPPCAPSPKGPRCHRAVWQRSTWVPSRAGLLGACNSTYTRGSRLRGQDGLCSNENFSISRNCSAIPPASWIQCAGETNHHVYTLGATKGWDFHSLRFCPPWLALCTSGRWHIWPAVGATAALPSVVLLLGGMSYCCRYSYRQA